MKNQSSGEVHHIALPREACYSSQISRVSVNVHSTRIIYQATSLFHQHSIFDSSTIPVATPSNW